MRKSSEQWAENEEIRTWGEKIRSREPSGSPSNLRDVIGTTLSSEKPNEPDGQTE